MLRNIRKTASSAMTVLCLVSTLALAQSQSSAPPIPQAQNPAVNLEQTQNPSEDQTRNMVCTKDDGKGNCTAAAGADGKEMVVVGKGLEKGVRMSCVDTGNVVNCKPTTT
jgi:hypothetical protein